MMCAHNKVYYDPIVVFVCLHITLPLCHRYAVISESTELLLNTCLVHFVTSVCLRLSQFAQLYFMQYMGLCVSSLPVSLMMIVRICVLYLIIIIKSEVWPICHCLWLGHETMVCTVCHEIIVCAVYSYIFIHFEHWPWWDIFNKSTINNASREWQFPSAHGWFHYWAHVAQIMTVHR